jgi:hypothetical protein
MYAIPVPQNAKENLEWNNAKSFAGLVLMHVLSVQKNAEV